MEYLVNGNKYNLSYSDLKEKYITFKNMSDQEFKENLPDAAHLACIICYLKEIPSYNCISDEGIIHELIHLMTCPNEPVVDLQEIRELFNKQLELS